MLPVFQNHSAWKRILRLNFTRWEKLAEFLQLTTSQKEQILQRPNFPLNLPLRLAEKIEKGTLNDPILKQFLPTVDELKNHSGYLNDPVGDQDSRKAPKLLHKYHGRALMLPTSACAMHCRYCFRQNFDYETQDRSFEQDLELISKDSTLHEIILSGGDPLSLSDEVLENLLITLNDMPHIRRIRFHTRFPIGIPERIDDSFLAILSNVRAQIWFVIHANHPRELDTEVIERLQTLKSVGATLLNQNVLLKDVNDNVQTLLHLYEQLVDAGILPYYLHQLDRVKGSAHFEVPEEKGLQLIEELSKLLPGYAVPKYVREIAGEPCKTPITFPLKNTCP